MSAGGLCMHGSMPSECVRCADRIVINELRAERDAQRERIEELNRENKEREESIATLRKQIAERDALRAQCYAECAAICRKAEDWSDGSLGWNRACKRMAIAIEHALADGKP